MDYKEFLESKVKLHQETGFNVKDKDLNKNLFDFQKFIVKWSLRLGKSAIFADCGLGKTLMQLEWANQIVKKTKKPVLILAPLAVSGQTIQEGEKFGIKVTKYNNQTKMGIYINNYEQLNNIDCSLFSGIVLDESSILKNFTGKYRNLIISNFADTPYKLACTATPSPNDAMELGNHAEFLNVMSRSEMLAMFFNHDGSNVGKWKIKGHGVKLFWQWVSSWAMMICKPSDIGFNDDGYNLPELNFIEKQLKTEKRDNGMLFNMTAISATNFNKELKFTLVDRLDTVAEIVNKSDDNFIIWVKQNEEEKYIHKLIPNSRTVSGSDKSELKEKNLLGFANDEFRVLITKTKIAQFGLNYQNCQNQVFASLDFSFEGLYQAIRRSYRFGQTKPVNIYLITTDTMENVIKSINEKKEKFETMQKEMAEASNKTFKEHNENLKITITDERNHVKTDRYEIFNMDCVKGLKKLEDNSIGFSVFSPPFAELYTYSDKIEDMGNSADYKEFFHHFQFLITELYRVMKPGRLVAVHCMDLPIQKSKEGFIGLRDFSGMLVNTFQEKGFIYHDRVTIWKDPVIEMQRTKALGLLHKQLKKDSSMSRTGIPDYLLVFRKDGDNQDPISNKDIPVELWQKYASPIWYDINYSDTLQFRAAREERDEKHICPLQLPTIERAITLWSNENDLVLSPFTGIGSEGYQAIKMNRRFIGFELKESYFNLACKNMERAINEGKQLNIMDLLEV